ncbi:MAG: hypothetical protein IPF78_16325 [Flavobacteriales bacterium]|nr:hypothetical protein [Flavobacteriales bacterium]
MERTQRDHRLVTTPDAGTPGSITLCASDAAIDLFGELGGTPDAGGAWTGPSAVTGGSFDPATMSAGDYTYTISVPLPCVNVSSTVTVAVQSPPDAGSDGALTLCISSPASNLFRLWAEAPMQVEHGADPARSPAGPSTQPP